MSFWTERARWVPKTRNETRPIQRKPWRQRKTDFQQERKSNYHKESMCQLPRWCFLAPNPLCKNLLSNDGWDTFKHLFLTASTLEGHWKRKGLFLLVSAAAPLFRGGEGHPETLCPSHATSLHIWTLGPAGPVPPPSTSCGSPGPWGVAFCLPSTAK